MTDSVDSSEKRKKNVLKIIEQKGLCSVMNTTKWKELKKVVSELPFQPPFVIKEVDEEVTSYHTFDQDERHEGDWGLYLENYLGGDLFATPYFAIEWVKVRPRILKTQGRLIADKVVDETEAFIKGLNQYGIPYEEQDGTVIIYGYKGN